MENNLNDETKPKFQQKKFWQEKIQVTYSLEIKSKFDALKNFNLIQVDQTNNDFAQTQNKAFFRDFSNSLKFWNTKCSK